LSIPLLERVSNAARGLAGAVKGAVKRHRDTEEERDLVAEWRPELARARSAKAKRQDETDRFWRFWRGEVYSPVIRTDEAGKGRPLRQRNYVRSTVEDFVALVCDNKPGVTALPRESGDIERAEKMTVLQDYCWDVQDMPVHHPVCVRAMAVSGMGVGRVLWNPDKTYPLGDPDFEVLDWKRVLTDPDGRDWFELSDMRYVAIEAWWPTWRIRREYPQAEVAPEVRERRGESEVIPADTDREVDGVGAPGATPSGEGAWVYHIWYREGDGKRLLVLAGGKVLKHEAWEGDFPFVFYPGYIEPEEDHPYPEGIVCDLLDAQRDMNLYASRLYEAMKYRPLTTLFYTDESGLDKDQVTNLEAVKMKVDKMGEAEWYTPPPIPADVFKWFENTKEDFHGLSGVRPTLQGQPDESRSGVAIGRLQDMALARIRQAMVNTDRAIVRIARLNDELIKGHMTISRQVRITGDSPLAQQAAPGAMGGAMGGAMPQAPATMPGMVMPPPPTAPKPRFAFTDVSRDDFFETLPGVSEPMMDEATGQPLADAMGQPLMREGEPLEREARFDYIFEAGSTLAGTKTQKRQEALTLAEKGFIDQEEVLKRFDYANWQEIVARTSELAQLRAFAQQAGPMLADYQGLMAAARGGGLPAMQGAAPQGGRTGVPAGAD
jgi:hypothetical protein